MEIFLNGREATLSDFIEADLARAVEISLFTWKRASADDELPGTSKFGWWGDTFPAVQGDQIGSKLWLLMRAKLTTDTLMKAREYARESLQWLIDDRIATAVDVRAERVGAERLDITVIVYKPDQTELNLRFQNVWE